MYAFLLMIFSALLWSFGNTMELFTLIFEGSIAKVYIYMGLIGLAIVPISLFYIGLIFSRTKIVFTWKHAFLFIPPVLDCILIGTNEIHGLFIEQYAVSNLDIVYGDLFLIHTVISYSYMFLGLYFLASASVKSTGFFSKQSMLIFTGILIPLTVNILYTLRLVTMNVYITTISFSAAVLLFVFAILKFNFLDVVPIALRNIVDNISDGFLVINSDLKVIDFNKTLQDTFENYLDIKRNMFVEKVFTLEDNNTKVFRELYDMIEKSYDTQESISADKHIVYRNFDRHFKIEVTPINTKSQGYMGMVMLLKDITQNVKDMQTIREKQEILMGQERLASLGQLIGGIAHNLKTPIMSISGGIEGLKDLIEEYEDSIGDSSVTSEDHHEIAGEMLEWVKKIKPHCAYMSDIISAVKGQAVKFNTSGLLSFTIDEVVKRIDILLKHELIRYHATMNTSVDVDRMTEVRGDINSLVQVLDNIIINAIQSYQGRKGKIVFKVVKAGANIIFIISDEGCGISAELKERLFKEMVTTKGKDGTGLGLFMSYSTIKGKFEGDMWFESEKGKGTTFYISIPKLENTIVGSEQ
jgi:signal transduction histidine kinase